MWADHILARGSFLIRRAGPRSGPRCPQAISGYVRPGYPPRGVPAAVGGAPSGRVMRQWGGVIVTLVCNTLCLASPTYGHAVIASRLDLPARLAGRRLSIPPVERSE
jgi:hypothetical protein